MIEITSTTNPLIKEIKSLAQKKYRDRLNKFLVEGVKGVEEAIKSDAVIDMVIVDSNKDSIQLQSIIEDAQHRDIKIVYVNSVVFESLADTQTPQGIAAVVFKMDTSGDTFFKDKSLLLLLENLQDPGNIGTIIRTADAAGIEGVILAGGADIYNTKVVRAAMGSLFHIPLIQVFDLDYVLKALREHRIKLISSDLSSTSYHWDMKFEGKLCIAVGNEGSGISEELRQASSELVKIPILGQAESLNASIAASILMYEAVRNRD